MRNLTQEAIELAEKELILQDPRLADKEFRKKLSSFDKQLVFQRLIMYATFFEQDLISKI